MLRVDTDISKLPEIQDMIQRAISEDIGSGDHSSMSCMREDQTSKARLIFKDSGIAAGLCLAYEVLRINDPGVQIQAYKKDGDRVSPGDTGFEVEGLSISLMKSERLLLNIMQRLSGIATITNKAAGLIKDYPCKVLDTRKTTPNLRLAEKWAVLVGGGMNHRFGLFDMIMLKDNHVDISGGIKPAIQKAKQYLEAKQLNLGIEIETRNLREVEEALSELPVQRIMLDNFNSEDTRQAVRMINHRCETEASGGINLENIVEYAATGVDFISLGMLTHSVKSLDISFKIK